MTNLSQWVQGGVIGLFTWVGDGLVYLSQFIDEMKASGFVAAALERSGQRDAMVAP